MSPFRRLGMGLVLCSFVASVGCKDHPRKVPPGVVSGTSEVVGKSWELCTWLGPSSHRKGIFGTDLGYEAPLPAANPDSADQLLLLFGDTYARAAEDCQYPRLEQDDLAARIPRERPASLTPGAPEKKDESSAACDSLKYSFEDPKEPTGWRPLRIFPDAMDNNPDRALDSGLNRTPVTAWGDGTHSFAIFYRGQMPRCNADAECPEGSSCSNDPSYNYPHLGGCTPISSFSSDAVPEPCRNNDDCTGPSTCSDLDAGYCIAHEPFQLSRDGQELTPQWYKSDPRDGLFRSMIIASAHWPDQPESYAIGAGYNTNKFVNVTARTVKHFDPAHPEDNDYTPGNETLLLWGRQGFVGHDRYQTLPFLLYQSLTDFIDDAGQIHWAPHYFAGYDPKGNPTWSDNEVDAKPIYGVDENLVQDADGKWKWTWRSPEFDYVNQMTVSYVEPLQRWIMLYGGEVTHELDPGRDGLPARTYPQSMPGAMYLRAARHPWGRATAATKDSDGYGPPRPVLTTQTVAKHLACGEEEPSIGACNSKLPQQQSDVIDSVGSAVSDFSFSDILEATAKCSAGGEVIDSQFSGFDEAGHLYGAAIIESWTQDVSDSLPDLQRGDRAVELYWNISTWNPYQALLVKTQLRASEFER